MSAAAYSSDLVSSPLLFFAAPWPPPNNHLYPYAKRSQRRILSSDAKVWRDAFLILLHRTSNLDAVRVQTPSDGLYALDLSLFPPDFRRRDVDGYTKLLMDSLCAELGIDDSRIVDQRVRKFAPHPGGQIVLSFLRLVWPEAPFLTVKATDTTVTTAHTTGRAS